MSNVPARPEGANPASSTTTTLPCAVHLGDPAALRAWLDAVRENVRDAVAAGRDSTARRKRRVLSRAEARRKLDGAAESLEALLLAAERGAARGEAPGGREP